MAERLRQLGVIRSDAVVRAFGAVPRHRFLPGLSLERVYRIDAAIPTHFDGSGVPISSSSAPVIMGVMLEMLEIEPGQRVLEVGAGTGYNAALMGHLVGDEGSVTSIDIDPEVTREAALHLRDCNSAWVRIVTGDGWLGQPEGIFDRVVITTECSDLSPYWVDQLAEGGFLVLPLWLRPGLSLAVAFQKRTRTLASRSAVACGFMPLRGPHAGPPRRGLTPPPPWEHAHDTERSQWVAVFDDVGDAPLGLLGTLLHGAARSRTAPAPAIGWTHRLALEMPDPIHLFRALPGDPRVVVGLFDRHLASLAVVVDDSIQWFGDPSCCDRLYAFLSECPPLHLAELRITARPHGSTEGSSRTSARMIRENFDFEVGTGQQAT